MKQTAFDTLWLYIERDLVEVKEELNDDNFTLTDAQRETVNGYCKSKLIDLFKNPGCEINGAIFCSEDGQIDVIYDVYSDITCCRFMIDIEQDGSFKERSLEKSITATS